MRIKYICHTYKLLKRASTHIRHGVAAAKLNTFTKKRARIQEIKSERLALLTDPLGMEERAAPS